MILPGTVVNTDESVINAVLPQWGYVQQSICHISGEYAHDEDGDGFHEVHVNTMEGFWLLLRFWLRPHRDSSPKVQMLRNNFRRQPLVELTPLIGSQHEDVVRRELG